MGCGTVCLHGNLRLDLRNDIDFFDALIYNASEAQRRAPVS